MDAPVISNDYMWVFMMHEDAVLSRVGRVLANAHGYRKLVRGREFVYASGTLPVLLVAHADTVHKTPPGEVFYDKENGVLWSPDGLGADDRAGVLGILELLRRGHRPHVLITTGEERGCTGARSFVTKVRDPGVRYVIELDRRGNGEAVFYNCTNVHFKDYVLGFGFVDGDGLYTDISTICPAWGVAGVNLSCGYYNAHTTNEYLKLGELWSTLERVEKMFAALPKRRFKYGVPHLGYDHKRRCVDDLDGNEPIYFVMSLDPYDLAHMYGGSSIKWGEWLQQHKETLQDVVDDAVWAAVDDLAQAEAGLV